MYSIFLGCRVLTVPLFDRLFEKKLLREMLILSKPWVTNGISKLLEHTLWARKMDFILILCKLLHEEHLLGAEAGASLPPSSIVHISNHLFKIQDSPLGT